MEKEDRIGRWLVFFTSLGLLAPSLMWSGFVLAKLWAWFVVPSFAVSPLTMPYAIGLTLIANRLTTQRASIEDAKTRSLEEWIQYTLRLVFGCIFGPLLALGVGAAVASFR